MFIFFYASLNYIVMLYINKNRFFMLQINYSKLIFYTFILTLLILSCYNSFIPNSQKRKYYFGGMYYEQNYGKKNSLCLPNGGRTGCSSKRVDRFFKLPALNYEYPQLSIELFLVCANHWFAHI